MNPSDPHDLVLGRRSVEDDAEEVFESRETWTGELHSDHSSPPKRAEDVWCTVFSPPSCAPGDTLMVQVYAHLRRQRVQVRNVAVEFDETATIRGSTALMESIVRGDELSFVISMPGAIVDPPLRSMRWRGVPDAVQFAITIPHAVNQPAMIGTVYITQGAVPFGEVKFRVGILRSIDRPQAAQPALQGEFRRYHYAFVSYASEDRVEVLKRVQVLSRLSIRYFQDLVSLEPGSRWEDQIQEEIRKSDVFYLFWSRHAKASPWVRQEVSYALARKSGDDAAPPAIVPIPIEGPPVVPPPEELQHLHFNDALLYFIRGSA